MSISLPDLPGAPDSWSPSALTTRMRMAALARSAQTSGAQISAPGRRGFLAKFSTQARDLVNERIAKGEVIHDVEAEVERAASKLLQIHMLHMAQRSRDERSQRSRRKRDE